MYWCVMKLPDRCSVDDANVDAMCRYKQWPCLEMLALGNCYLIGTVDNNLTAKGVAAIMSL